MFMQTKNHRIQNPQKTKRNVEKKLPKGKRK